MEEKVEIASADLKEFPEETVEAKAAADVIPPASFTGTVVFRLENAGSKSEGTFPFLYLKNGVFLRIWREGDYSAFGDGMREFDGGRVTAYGKQDENGTLVVTKIEPTDASEDHNQEKES